MQNQLLFVTQVKTSLLHWKSKHHACALLNQLLQSVMGNIALFLFYALLLTLRTTWPINLQNCKEKKNLNLLFPSRQISKHD